MEGGKLFEVLFLRRGLDLDWGPLVDIRSVLLGQACSEVNDGERGGTFQLEKEETIRGVMHSRSGDADAAKCLTVALTFPPCKPEIRSQEGHNRKVEGIYPWCKHTQSLQQDTHLHQTFLQLFHTSVLELSPMSKHKVRSTTSVFKLREMSWKR